MNGLLNLTDDYEIRKILGFLREREVGSLPTLW